MLRSTDRRKERSMAKLQEVRKTIEASLGNMTPTRAQEIAKGMLDRDAAKEQVSKTAADLMEWSQRNRARLSTMIRGEVRDQLRQSGVATSEEVNALRKRVRDLERIVKATGASRSTAKRTAGSGSKRTPPKSAAKRSDTTTE
jgi:polyhydroxyalkanoate synthesis regulator phasin